ncbi:MAG: Glycosyl transferase, family 2 [Parcubacteria group bacterium GW2011_GWA2_36_10]|nr:MAG: Glycosyl transferase, family 2 [Parcubacteria group bacterium GW2011_GWA2_36_10]
MPKPQISIIIVNWKVRPLLEKCLESILADTESFSKEIFVVDNDSRDGTPEMIMADYHQVTMIALPRNRGFARANNLALKQSSGEYIFLLNPDTEIQLGFFKTILAYFQAHPKVALLGPRILNSDLSQQASIRRFPNLISQLLVLFKLTKVWPDNKFLKKYLATDFDYNREQEVEQIMGAAMIMPRATYEKIGLFDQRFFLWLEEVDYCKRIKDAGLLIKYLPTASLVHHSGISFSKERIFKKQLIFDWSLLYYFFKQKNIFQALIILIFLPINLLLTAGYAWWKNNYQNE